MLPLNILKNSKKTDVLVELKSGDSVKGKLHSIDNFMNVKLKDVIYVKKEGPTFYNCNECFIRGSMLNSIQLRDDIIEKIKDIEEIEKQILIRRNENKEKREESIAKESNITNKDHIRRTDYKDKQKKDFYSNSNGNNKNYNNQGKKNNYNKKS